MTRIHISLQTADLPLAVAFYEALFGEAPDKREHDYARFQPTAAPITLALMPGTPAPGPHHLGLKLATPDEARGAWARLAAAGLEVRTEEDVSCCWSVQDKAWVKDPDGRPWEIYTVTDDTPAPPDGRPSACCT